MERLITFGYCQVALDRDFEIEMFLILVPWQHPILQVQHGWCIQYGGLKVWQWKAFGGGFFVAQFGCHIGGSFVLLFGIGFTGGVRLRWYGDL